MPASEADETKLKNLMDRRKVYGDITQSVKDPKELEDLLKRFGNRVPLVIGYLEARARQVGRLVMIPPAFYERDGSLYQPPALEIDLETRALIKIDDRTR